MIPVFSDRRTDWPSHPHATRDSLHEHDMWVAEGLTHRYPTKVLAELLPTCPQYCGHCTRMDLVGNSTPVIEKLKFAAKPADRLGDMMEYLRRTPSVRDVVVSGGDVANMPWPRLEDFLTKLLEIENIRDVRLATKALMGLPQHWLQDDVVDGMGRVAGLARSRGVSIAIHTHVNHANSVTPLVAKATRAMLDTGIRDVRNQGVLMNGVNADPEALLDLCFRLLDGAQIMPYYFYMCDLIPFAEHWRVSVADAQRLQHAIMGYLPGFATPRIVCDVPFVGKRWVHQLESYDTERGHLALDQELPDLHRGHRPRGPAPDLRVLRPDPHPPRHRPGLVAGARSPRRVRPQGRRGRRGLPADRCAPGVLTRGPLLLRFGHQPQLIASSACGLVTNRNDSPRIRAVRDQSAPAGVPAPSHLRIGHQPQHPAPIGAVLTIREAGVPAPATCGLVTNRNNPTPKSAVGDQTADPGYVTGRFSNGVDSTMVVRVETLATERIWARSSSS